jgi:hypothetical protein
VAATLIGCDRLPVAPTPLAGNTAAAAAVAAADVPAFLNDALGTMQRYSVNTHDVDWPRLREEVATMAGHAQTIAEASPAILHALQSLKDYESYFAFGSSTVGPSPVGGCPSGDRAAPSLPDTIAYVRVSGCNCNGFAADSYATALHHAIRNADRPGLDGWIVDLRGNGGGNMWPMMAGVGPVMGEGIMGYIIYNDRDYEREYTAGGSQSFGDVFARATDPYTLIRPNPRVAVLTDGGTVSAGEAMTVWFKERPNTRSFGAATCGHHHLLQDFSVKGGGTLLLVTAHNADRTKRAWAGPIAPDESFSDPAKAVSRAIDWLRSGR